MPGGAPSMLTLPAACRPPAFDALRARKNMIAPATATTNPKYTRSRALAANASRSVFWANDIRIALPITMIMPTIRTGPAVDVWTQLGIVIKNSWQTQSVPATPLAFVFRLRNQERCLGSRCRKTPHFLTINLTMRQRLCQPLPAAGGRRTCIDPRSRTCTASRSGRSSGAVKC